MSDPPVISFLSDFGHRDEFVGVVHGVIATIAPECRVIDLTHEITPGDIRGGALSLMRAVQYVPTGVVLAVVDPGVGTERRAIAVETGSGYFVGPDNGLLAPAVAMVGGAHRAVAIENPDVMLPRTGMSFDGRDRFGPAAAVLASGQATMDELGPDLDSNTLNSLLLPLPEIDGSRVTGQAWWIDRFGNVQLNIAPDEMAQAGMQPGGVVAVRVGASNQVVPWVTSYGDVEEGEPLIHIDGSGLMALAVRGGSAAEHLVLATGVPVVLAPGLTVT